MRKLILAAGTAAMLLATPLTWAHGGGSTDGGSHSIHWQIQLPLGGHYGRHDHRQWQNHYGAWWRHRDHRRRHYRGRRDHSHGHGGYRHDHDRGGHRGGGRH